ncbi:MAG: penicillin-binding protein 2 [Candidatus Symbiothrix sp.]|jgi:penicillin-binding protein 2|nr:penicillin-binding protein 2 [Candidatus Symbiothrix sp.]
MRTNDFNSNSRKTVLVLIICSVVAIYVIQLFRLQVLSSNYKDRADSNAFLNRVQYPSRGLMRDRNDKLLVYNQPAYDVMIVMRETEKFDTLAFCRAVNIDIQYFRKRLSDIKNKNLNPGYSSYTAQVLLPQLGNKEYGILQESIYKFPGFYIQKRTIREYTYPNAGHVFGYIAEADKKDIEKDEYYKRGDYIGKTGLEKSYEPYLRGQKGIEILLRDAHGRIKGKFDDGKQDVTSTSGKDLTLSIDMDLQIYGETLMQNKLGTIIMIEPKTGEILCMVSSPGYDPASLVGRQFGTAYTALERDPYLPLLNRALNGAYPPGSTFKTAQALTFLQEGIIEPETKFACYHGFPLGGGHPGCHGHASPLALVPGIGNSCNSYFAWGLMNMLNSKKYKNIQESMDTWRDHMVAQGFGYRLGVDMPDEKRGLIPNSDYYNKIYKGRWNPFTVISISIGQGEVLLSPIQICNLATTIANRGYYYAPHVVKRIQDTPLDSIYTHPHYTGIDRQHYETVAEGMRWAVAGPGGTCHQANIPDIEVCGKTGTAQNAAKDHSIFMGFAPMNDPKVAVMVFVENGGFGATYAVPMGRLMIEKYLKGDVRDKNAETYLRNAKILRNVVPKV